MDLIRLKKTALDGLNWMIQAHCMLMRLRDYFKIKDKIRKKIRTKKTAPAGRTTRRMDFNPETLSFDKHWMGQFLHFHGNPDPGVVIGTCGG